MRLSALAVCAAALVVPACSSDPAEQAVYGDADSGTEILVDAGEQFEIQLDSNPSTGYSWEIADDAGLNAVELITRDHEPADTELVGASGVDVFVFEAVAGAQILRLEYARSFDDPVVPERIVEYIVRVDEAPWPPDDVVPPGTSSATAPIEIGVLLAGEVPAEATVTGYVVWDDDDARLCEVLMESYPPQCGGVSLVIANPEALTVELEEEQSVRWSKDRVQVVGTFDGTGFTLR
jgi:predicted secreted protein